MSKGESLHKLVKSLKKSDKRYFKKLVQFGTGKKSSHATYLFDCLAKMEVYDEPRLLIELDKRGMAGQLRVYQTLLFDQLMRVLRLTRRKDDLRWKMRKELTEIEILFERNILEACHKKIEKNLEICKKHNLQAAELELHEWRYRLKMDKSKTGLDEGFRESQLERLGTGIKISSSLEAGLTEAFSRRLLRKDSFRRRSEIKDSLDALMENLRQSPPDKKQNLPAWSGWKRSEANLAFINKDFEGALQHYGEFLDTWEREKNWLQQHPEVYLSVLNNFMNCCQLINKPYLYLQKIDLLSQMEINRPEVRNQYQFTALSQKLMYNIHFRGMKETGMVIREFEAWLNDPSHHAPTGRILVIYFNIVSVCFVHGKFQKANQWLNRILTTPGKTERRDIREFARIFQLVLHWELGNFDLVDNLLNSTYRFLRSKNQYTPYEQLILSFCRKQGYQSEVPHLAWKEFRLKIEKFLDMPVGHRPMGVSELSLWVQSKHEKRSIQSCFQERVDRLKEASRQS